MQKTILELKYHFFFSPQFFVEVMGVALGNTRIKLSVIHSVPGEEFSLPPPPQFPFYLTQMKNLQIILSSLFFLTVFTEASDTITRLPCSVQHLYKDSRVK